MSISPSSMVEEVKNELITQIDRRFGHIEENHLVAISCLLDPRFKNIHFKDARACAKAILSARHQLEIANSSTSSDDADSDSLVAPAPVYDFWSHHKNLAHKQKEREGSSMQLSVKKQDEMSLYLAAPVSPLSTNPFEQWEDMKTVFPHLYNLAHEYLAIPATSVPSERLFSKAGSTLTKIRNRLSPKRLDKLLFLSDCTEEEWEL